MIIRFKFTSFDGQVIEGMRTELDRNYEDEETALVFIEDEHHADTEGYFELNIRKDKQGHLTPDGYVAEYESSDECESAHITELDMLQVQEHDFDGMLRVANDTLQPFDKKIFADYDGECYWSIGSADLDGSNPEYYAEGNFVHEVGGLINECLAHVLAGVKQQKKQQQDKKDRLLKETIVLLAADLYQTIYNRDDCGGWGDACDDIIGYAEQFEKELNWQEDDERDYIQELEKFEKKILNDLNE